MFATRVSIPLIAVCLAARVAHGQPETDDGEEPAGAPAPGGAAEAAGQESAPSPGVVRRPELLVDAQPRYPEAAWREQREADVVVLLTVDETGVVTDVALVEGAGHGFDEEALRTARKLRFSPAAVDGQPVAVQIRYTFRFRVPEKDTVAAPPAACPACAVDARKKARIAVTVLERGRGSPMAGVEVYLLDEDRVILTGEDGRFEVEVPPGAHAFTIRPPGFYPYHATERVEEGQVLELRYYVRRHRRSKYTTVVWGSEGRAEVARTSLVEDEIRSVAGTMGDPIRVALLLPGASSSVSGLGYPIVRGALPGDSLYEIDGIRVPMLYHLLFGPAVVHPRFVEEIIYQPGGYSAEHGRFPGGRIGATTARVDDTPVWVADLSIVETSLLRSQKLGDSAEMVAAARYGTLGYIVEGLAANTVFRYWDYQARTALRTPGDGKITLTVLGASDTAGESDPDTGFEDVLSLGFHTLDLRFRQPVRDAAWLVAGAQLTHEFFDPPVSEADDTQPAELQSARPYLELGWGAGDLEVRGGGDVLVQDFGLDLSGDDDIFGGSPTSGITLGAWSALEWQLGPVIVNPSVRLDHYRYRGGGSPRETAVDPRLSAVYAVTDRLDLKAAAGVHSGPSRFSFVEPPLVFGPIPAFEGPGLARGLSRTLQYQAGAELQLSRDFELSVTGYYHDQHAPIDFSLIDKPLDADPTPCNGDDAALIDPLDVDGESYGGELLVRRRLGSAIYGWASYALSRSERTTRTGVRFPFEFDQRHVFNGVVSWEVGRNWTLGGVFHINTGRPYTPMVVDRCGQFYDARRGAPNAGRLPTYWRLDVRIQKREVFDTWFFDFYIDFFNAAFQFETIDYELNYDTGALTPVTVPLFIPMIGVRGEF